MKGMLPCTLTPQWGGPTNVASMRHVSGTAARFVLGVCVRDVGHSAHRQQAACEGTALSCWSCGRVWKHRQRAACKGTSLSRWSCFAMRCACDVRVRGRPRVQAPRRRRPGWPSVESALSLRSGEDVFHDKHGRDAATINPKGQLHHLLYAGERAAGRQAVARPNGRWVTPTQTLTRGNTAVVLL